MMTPQMIKLTIDLLLNCYCSVPEHDEVNGGGSFSEDAADFHVSHSQSDNVVYLR